MAIPGTKRFFLKGFELGTIVAFFFAEFYTLEKLKIVWKAFSQEKL